MIEALREARIALREREVPVGAVVVAPGGEIVSRAHNQPLGLNDPTAHAEILALREAGRFFGNYRLNGTTLVVTVEPCLMCMGAAIHARVRRVVFALADSKTGAAGSLYNIAADRRLNHQIDVVSGVMAEQSRQLMIDFFRSRRQDEKQRKPLWRGTEVVVTGSTRNRLVP